MGRPVNRGPMLFKSCISRNILVMLHVARITGFCICMCVILFHVKARGLLINALYMYQPSLATDRIRTALSFRILQRSIFRPVYILILLLFYYVLACR